MKNSTVNYGYRVELTHLRGSCTCFFCTPRYLTNCHTIQGALAQTLNSNKFVRVGWNVERLLCFKIKGANLFQEEAPAFLPQIDKRGSGAISGRFQDTNPPVLARDSVTVKATNPRPQTWVLIWQLLSLVCGPVP